MFGLALKEPSFVDDKVLPRKDYEYRVIAVNEGGESEPSESSGFITARPDKGSRLLVHSDVLEEATH